MTEVRLGIEGMTCDHCVRAVDGALRAVPGVQQVQVAIGEAKVNYDPQAASIERMVDAIEDQGYVAYRSEAS